MTYAASASRSGIGVTLSPSPAPSRWAGGTYEVSLSATTRGLSPAWTDRMPSTVSVRSSTSSDESAFRRFGHREVDHVGRPDTHQGGDEGRGDRRAEGRWRRQVLEHVDEPHHRADDPDRRGEAAGLLEREHASVVPGRHPVDLGVEDVAHELGVGAVDDQLQALLGERVVDLGDLGVERQQALAARLLGERDEEVDASLDVERLGVDDALVQRKGSSSSRPCRRSPSSRRRCRR